MERYTLVEYEAAAPEVRELYDDYLLSTGAPDVPIWLKSLGNSVDLARAYWMRTKGSLIAGTLPTVLKELVVFVVSIENGSRYCAACHAHAVLQLDRSFTYGDLLALVEREARLGLPTAYRSAIEFAVRMSQAPNDVTDEEFAALADAGYGPDEIRELLTVVDLAVMFNVYASGARLPIDPGYRPILA